MLLLLLLLSMLLLLWWNFKVGSKASYIVTSATSGNRLSCWAAGLKGGRALGWKFFVAFWLMVRRLKPKDGWIHASSVGSDLRKRLEGDSRYCVALPTGLKTDLQLGITQLVSVSCDLDRWRQSGICNQSEPRLRDLFKKRFAIGNELNF